MINDVKKDANQRMLKSIESLRLELNKIRTGRASPAILEHVQVSYYGTPTPLSQVANVNVQDARTLAVTPWEKAMVAVVEKAILESDLGLNPVTAGDVIRVPMPALTEERRKSLVKLVKAEGENAKVAIRNIRRDAISLIKDLLKDKEITEDDDKRAQDEIQTITNQSTDQVDEVIAAKEVDVMAV